MTSLVFLDAKGPEDNAIVEASGTVDTVANVPDIEIENAIDNGTTAADTAVVVQAENNETRFVFQEYMQVR
jgi:hypothetical protein